VYAGIDIVHVGSIDLSKEMRAGHIVNIGDRFFWLR